MDDELSMVGVAAFSVVGVSQLFPNVVSLVANPNSVIAAAIASTVLTFLISILIDGGGPPTRPEGRA